MPRAWIWRYGDMEIWRLQGSIGRFLLVFSFSSLLIGSRPGTNGDGTGFTTYHWRWISPCTGSTERSPSSGTDRQRDLQGRTRAYELGFFLLLFMYGYAAQEVCR